jgi:hypothetical protein
MLPTQILTGTITILSPSLQEFAIYLPIDGSAVLGWAAAFSLILVLFAIAFRFQMWVLLLDLMCAVLYVPFSLTGFAPYLVVLLLFAMVFGFLIRFLVNLLYGNRKRRAR